MSTSPSIAPKTPWERDRRPRWGLAASLAAVLVLVAAGWLPVDWLRAVFGRHLNLVNVKITERVESLDGIRLIPVPRRGPAATAPAPPRAATPSLRSDVEHEPVPTTAAERTFVWDPTSAWTPADELVTPAVPDSVVRRALLLDALSLGRVERAFAYFDTTQVTAAARRFDWMDAWMNGVMRPLFEAQGRAQRIADIYHRAVGEVEEEGGL